MNWTSSINSLCVASLTALLATVMGLLAAVSAAGSARMGRLHQMGWCLILALPPFFVTSGWLYFFGFAGEYKAWLPFKLFSLAGLCAILAFIYWPVAAWIVYRRLLTLDPSLWEWENDWSTSGFWGKVLLPFLRPSLATSFLIVFVLAISQFSVPSLLQVKVLPEDIWLRMNADLNYRSAAILLSPIFLSIGLVLYGVRKFGFFKESHQGARQFQGFPKGIIPGGFHWVAGLAMLISLFFPIAPVMGSVQTWRSISPALVANWEPLAVSILSSILVPLLLFVFIVFFSKKWMMPGAAFLFLTPGLAISLFLIVVVNRPGLGWLYPSLGCVFVCLGLKYSAPILFGNLLGAARSQLRIVSQFRLEGAGALRARALALPMVYRELLGPLVVTSLLVIWDVETVVMIMPPGRETLSLRVFNMLHYGHNSQINAIGMILMFAAILLVAGLLSLQAFFRGKYHRLILPCALAVFTALGSSCSPAKISDRGGASFTAQSKLFSSVQIIGSKGTGAGQFNKPRSVAVDENDNLYVVDMTGRVQKFDDHGLFLTSWQMPQTDLGKPKGMCIDESGNLVLVEPHYSRVNHFSSTNSSLLAQWGVHGTNDGQLAFPRSIAVLADGTTFVTEYGQRERICCFSARGGRFLFSFGEPGPSPGQFNRAEGICSDSKGMIYVADSCNHRIQVFNSHGKFEKSFGTPGRGAGEMNYPYDVRVDARGYCFVCEFGNSRIQVFKGSSEPVEIIGQGGSAPFEFSNPWSIALDKHGNLYVADALNHRVQKLCRIQESGTLKTSTKAQSL